jgi:RHS repeat-associated protein
VSLSSQSTTYDAAGNVASQTNGDKETTTYAYDPLNRTISVTDSLNRVTSYTYDPAGNQLTVTDPSGRVTTTAYDADNEAISVTYSDGVTPNVAYTYDADGRRLTMTDGTGTTTYTYDALGRLTSDTQGGGQVVKYGYDLASNLTSLTDQGNTVTRTYDADGRMTAVKDWLGNTTTFSYDKDSNLVAQSDPNGVVTTNEFDKADRLVKSATKSGDKILLDLDYARNALGNVTAENSTTYGYDGAQRLTSSTSSASSWSYDHANQLTSAGPTTYAYDAASELSSATVRSKVTGYTYDPEGERTTTRPPSGQASTYTWNQAGDLSGFIRVSTTATYTYNGDGLRMSETVGTAKYPFVWDVAEGTPLLLANVFTEYVTGPGGLPLEQVTGSKVTYFTHDQLGSTRLLTNAKGKSAGRYTYSPYGAVASHTGSVSTNLQFAGQFTDNESGLQYLQARYYDPATGQFLSVDPLVTVTSQPYEYAEDDPVNDIDSTGAETCTLNYVETSFNINNCTSVDEGEALSCSSGPDGACTPCEDIVSLKSAESLLEEESSPAWGAATEPGPTAQASSSQGSQSENAAQICEGVPDNAVCQNLVKSNEFEYLVGKTESPSSLHQAETDHFVPELPELVWEILYG